jgi:transposase-like protein
MPPAVAVVLHCPHCGMQHVDKGKWALFAHKRHLCYGCGRFWEPFGHPTIGVEG